MCFGKSASTPAEPTGSGPGGREKTTDEFYEEMKPGPFELPLLAVSERVERAPVSYGGIVPKQRSGSVQRSLLVPFIRPPMMSSNLRKSS